MKFLNQFIEELQALEEATKKKILVVGTIVAMGVVVYLWVGYFGSLITGIPQEQAVATSASASSTVATSTGAGSGGNIFGDMANGFANIYNAFRGPAQYNITPSSN